jgi:DnaJ-class molecular chaperone
VLDCRRAPRGLREPVPPVVVVRDADGMTGSGETDRTPPACGHCEGSGSVSYERPHQQDDGSVIWQTSVENCHVCHGSGTCR